jgi:hypothetical protein
MQCVAMHHMGPVFFLSILWCSQGGNHTLANLANLGYWQNMKGKNSSHLLEPCKFRIFQNKNKNHWICDSKKFQIFCNSTELHTKNEGFIRHVMTRGGGYVNGLENKVQMDLEQSAHAHKNKERVDI